MRLSAMAEEATEPGLAPRERAAVAAALQAYALFRRLGLWPSMGATEPPGGSGEVGGTGQLSRAIEWSATVAGDPLTAEEAEALADRIGVGSVGMDPSAPPAPCVCNGRVTQRSTEQ